MTLDTPSPRSRAVTVTETTRNMFDLQDYSESPVHFLVPTHTEAQDNPALRVGEDESNAQTISVDVPGVRRRRPYFSSKMIPVQYTESVSAAPVPSYTEQAYVTYMDFSVHTRSRDKVDLSPTLAPTTYNDAIICFRDCTRKRFIHRVEYQPKLKPQNYEETCFVLPKRAVQSYVSFMDYHVDETRKWYKTAVKLRPKTYSNTTVHNFRYDTFPDDIEAPSHVNGDINANDVHLRDDYKESAYNGHQAPLVNGYNGDNGVNNEYFNL